MCLFFDLFGFSCEPSLFCLEGKQPWLLTFALPSSLEWAATALGSVDIGGEKWSFYSRRSFGTSRLLCWGKWSSGSTVGLRDGHISSLNFWSAFIAWFHLSRNVWMTLWRLFGKVIGSIWIVHLNTSDVNVPIYIFKKLNCVALPYLF